MVLTSTNRSRQLYSSTGSSLVLQCNDNYNVQLGAKKFGHYVFLKYFDVLIVMRQTIYHYIAQTNSSNRTVCCIKKFQVTTACVRTY